MDSLSRAFAGRHSFGPGGCHQSVVVIERIPPSKPTACLLRDRHGLCWPVFMQGPEYSVLLKGTSILDGTLSPPGKSVPSKMLVPFRAELAPCRARVTLAHQV